MRREYNKDLSRKLRLVSTPTEQIVWNQIRSHQIQGFKFRRQHPIGPYVVDFYCPKFKLILEIDGDIHTTDHQIEHDRKRDQYLIEKGYTILHATNNDVRNNLEGLKQKLFNLTLALSLKRRGK